MKIAILNQPLGNRGDESAHKAFVRVLAQRFFDSQIDVIFMNQNVELISPFKVSLQNVNYVNLCGFRGAARAQKIGLFLNCPFLTLVHPLLFNFYKRMKSYDYVICAPGGICMGGFMDWDHLWKLLLVKRMNKKILYWGRSIGPFSSENWKKSLFKKYSEELLRYFLFLGLRDSKSIKIAHDLKINCTEMIDSAFLDVPNVNLPLSIAEQLSNSKYIIFVPNELTWHYRFRNVEKKQIDNFYLKIIDILQKHYSNYLIVMLPQTYKSSINDYDYFKALETKTINDNLLIFDENQDSDIQQKIISGSEFVIGARYHSIVFAINNNIPFISLSYEHKMVGLLETLGEKEYLLEIQDIFDVGNEQLYTNVLTCFENKIQNLLLQKTNRLNTKDIVYKAFNQLASILV